MTNREPEPVFFVARGQILLSNCVVPFHYIIYVVCVWVIYTVRADVVSFAETVIADVISASGHAISSPVDLPSIDYFDVKRLSLAGSQHLLR